MRRKAKLPEKKTRRESAFKLISGSRALVTIKSDSKVWKSEAEIKKLSIGGAIVRLIPPADATDFQLEELKTKLEARETAAIKVLPRQQLGKAGESDDDPKREASKDLRAAVLDVAGRMATDDRTALLEELNSAMDEAGI